MSSLSRDEVLRSIARLEPVLRADGMTGLSLFGSRARQDDRDQSDIDLLAEIDSARRLSLLDIIGMEQLIGDALKLDAHITLRRGLDEDFKRVAERDAIKIF